MSDNDHEMKQEERIFKSFKFFLEAPKFLLSWLIRHGNRSKDSKKNFLDFFTEDLEWSNTKIKKNFTKDQIEKLKINSSSETFDITLQTKLIDLYCEGTDFSESTISDDSTLEYWIKQFKDKRNFLCHHSMKDLQDKFKNDDFLKESKTLCEQIISKASLRFKIELNEINEKLHEFNRRFDQLLNHPLSLKGNESYVSESLIQEVKFLYNKENVKTNPYYFRCNSFENIFVGDLYVQLKIMQSKFQEEDQNISANNILNLFNNKLTLNKNSPFVLIKGPAGAGKSTLIQKIIADWCGNVEFHEFNRISEYDLILYIECRNSVTDNLENYFRKLVPFLFRQPGFVFIEFLNLVKCQNLLILIDGIDEINKNSHLLVQEIVSEFYSKDIIFTTRVESEGNIWSVLPPNKNITTLELLGIPDHQWYPFIVKYFKALISQGLNEDNLKNKGPDKLLNILEKSQHDIKNLIRLPLTMALVVYLYITSDETFDFQLTNDLLEKLLTSNKQKVIKRLKAKREFNTVSEIKIAMKLKKIQNEVQKIAFETLLKNEIILSDETYEHLYCVCDNEGMIPEEVLTIFLTCKTPDQTQLIPNFSFHHKSFQEYLAALHIYKTLKHDDSIFNTIHETLDRSTTYIGLSNKRKLYNCMKMLMNFLVNDNEKILLSKWCKDIVNISFEEDVKINLISAHSFLRYCKTNEDVAKCLVSRLDIKNFEIHDDNHDTARVLMQYIIPPKIKIYINFEETIEGDSFEKFIELVSNKEGCKVELYDEFHYNKKFSDLTFNSYFETLCNSR